MSLNYKILLDQNEFNNATHKLRALCDDLAKLHNRIETMLATLEVGFDTPAGRQFSLLCRNGLMEPMDKQRLVIDHVANNLESSKNAYESVFNAYQDLNNSINN